MKPSSEHSPTSFLLYQNPESRVTQVKSVLGVMILFLTALLINDSCFNSAQNTYAFLITIVLVFCLYGMVTSDTTSIVSGILLWILTLFVCYMAWHNDGLYDTSIVAFPCLSIFAFMLGGLTLLIPLTIFMTFTFYFLAYAGHQGILIQPSIVDKPLWSKANDLSIIMVVYSLGIYLVSRYINQLLTHLSSESIKNIEFQDKAEKQLQLDFMTGLPNEVVCQEKLNTLLNKEGAREDIIGVATLDLRNFQWVNSSLGHHVGDNVICMIGSRLHQLMTPKTTLYRASGNEFIVLIEASDYEDITSFCHQINQAVQRPLQIDDYDIEISSSIGISTAPFDGISYQDLRQKSHAALYQAKEDDVQHCRFFEMEMEQLVIRRIRMVQELKQAIANEEFSLFYQPKVELATGQVKGTEALIRWHNSRNELISPAEFIPIAEESGLINEIGKWAIQKACQDCRDWHDLGMPISVAVNLSPVQFKRGNLPNIIFRALKQSGLDPTYLELEITESMFIEDAEQTKDQIHQFVNHGISIAIDDFGTGYSNLNYLAKFNASTLKIDMSFVRYMMESTQHLHIVNAVISMAGVMQLECVAEGVEDQEIADKLNSLGCQYGQGFFWSKPIPKNDFTQFLLEHSLDDVSKR